MSASTDIVSRASECLPHELLHKIYNYHLGIISKLARKIQQCYFFYKGWICDDCRSPRAKHKLERVHACDDWYGCCYKYVCSDACLYYCENDHEYYDKCQKRWMDPPPYDPRSTDPDEYSVYEWENHNLYTSRTHECPYCSGNIYIDRQFSFDNYEYLRENYNLRVFGSYI